jgi:hypothetical protein
MVNGEFSDAIQRIEMTQMDWYYWSPLFTASAHCSSGNFDDGRRALDAALEMQPELQKAFWSDLYFWHKGPDVRPLFDALSVGLEACGWEVPPDPGREALTIEQ